MKRTILLTPFAFARCALLCLLILPTGQAGKAWALSELPEEEVTSQPEIQTVPLPPPLSNPANEQQLQPGPRVDEPDAPVSAPDGEIPGGAEADGAGGADNDIAVPTVSYDIDALPEPVRLTRSLILEATRKGDIDALRPLLMADPESPTQLSLGAADGDPVDFLREMSGDDQGHEILAIMQEVLEAGYVHMDIGTDNEIYLWPYFFAVPLEGLTPTQRVELFRLVTAGDYEDMKTFGAYIFYRTGIRPNGRWAFFVAGD